MHSLLSWLTLCCSLRGRGYSTWLMCMYVCASVSRQCTLNCFNLAMTASTATKPHRETVKVKQIILDKVEMSGTNSKSIGTGVCSNKTTMDTKYNYLQFQPGNFH